jgi:hypothetical protein
MIKYGPAMMKYVIREPSIAVTTTASKSPPAPARSDAVVGRNARRSMLEQVLLNLDHYITVLRDWT